MIRRVSWHAMLLAWAWTLSAFAAAHGPGEMTSITPTKNVEGEQSETLEHWYRLFSDLCYVAPTPLQQETLQEAESIYQLLYGPPVAAPQTGDVEHVFGAARRHYDRLTQEYSRGAIALGWTKPDHPYRAAHIACPRTRSLSSRGD